MAASPKTGEKATGLNRPRLPFVLERLFVLLRPAPRTTPPPKQGAMPPAAAARPRRPRDSQRRRVYAWEAAVLKPTVGRRLSLASCAGLIEEVYRWHEQPAATDRNWRPPALGDGRGRRHACGSRSVIKLPRWARTRAIVLHECAHGMSDDGHGPRFVRVYVTLLCRFAGHDQAALEASLRAHKIAIAPAG
jgi:hypothetical protein